MSIVGPNAPGSGPNPGLTPQEDSNPLSEIQKLLDAISKAEIDAMYVDPSQNTKVILDLNKVEMIVNKYSTDSANPQLYNKWLGLETTLTKALGKFSMDLKILLAGVNQMGQAQTMLQSQIPGEGGVATPGGQSQAESPPQAHTGQSGPQHGHIGAGERSLPTGERR